MNAAPYQDVEVHQWLVSILTEIAKKTGTSPNPNCEGDTVDVIVEILE